MHPGACLLASVGLTAAVCYRFWSTFNQTNSICLFIRQAAQITDARAEAGSHATLGGGDFSPSVLEPCAAVAASTRGTFLSAAIHIPPFFLALFWITGPRLQSEVSRASRKPDFFLPRVHRVSSLFPFRLPSRFGAQACGCHSSQLIWCCGSGTFARLLTELDHLRISKLLMRPSSPLSAEAAFAGFDGRSGCAIGAAGWHACFGECR